MHTGKIITLNLNGNTLTAKDSGGDTVGAIYAYGNTTVYGGTVKGENAIVFRTGTLNVNGGSLIGTTNRGIYVGGEGTINIQNNSIITGNKFGINGSGINSITINVYSGTITGTIYDGISIAKNSTINVSGGKISGKENGILIYENSYSNITVNNGEIYGKYGIGSDSSGNITINGGTVKGTDDGGLRSKSATLNVNGGNITGKVYGIINTSGTVNMNNGTVRGYTYDGISQSGDGRIYLNSGTVIGVNWAVYAPGGIVYYKNSAPYISLTSSNNLWDNGRYALYAVNYQNI